MLPATLNTEDDWQNNKTPEYCFKCNLYILEKSQANL